MGNIMTPAGITSPKTLIIFTAVMFDAIRHVVKIATIQTKSGVYLSLFDDCPSMHIKLA